ncbi:GlxA family transcriptional regulator [Hwanghaeella grinnelliae]|nr:GlxA family transcriptional regulator [Hwanghaeella grinnelliae]
MTLHNTGPFRVGFLLIDGFALLSYSSAAEPMRAANHLAGKRLYDVRHIPVAGGRSVSSSGAVIEGTATLDGDRDFDLVLVVAGGDPARFDDGRVFQWLRMLARRGVQIGGVSGGPVILARAGVLAGRRMTVHWEHVQTLAEITPSLLVERSLYVIDRDRMTCAGGTAALDMMHAVITRHHGAAFARRVSDWFMHTDVRPSGGPQRAGLVERYGVSDPAVIQAIEMMENHVADPLSLDQLAHLCGLGARQLNRLFSEKLGASTMAFYRGLRLEKARNLLEQSVMSVTEIALATGFASSAHFSTAFKSRFRHAPSKIR